MRHGRLESVSLPPFYPDLHSISTPPWRPSNKAARLLPDRLFLPLKTSAGRARRRRRRKEIEGRGGGKTNRPAAAPKSDRGASPPHRRQKGSLSGWRSDRASPGESRPHRDEAFGESH